MTLNLYNCGDAPNVLHKNISVPQTVDVSANGVNTDFGVTRPIITIAGNISGYNYAGIPDFGRYYFIDDIKVVRNGITQMTLRVDVLMSYSSAISALPCVAIRSQQKTAQTPYLYDSKRPLACYQVYKTFKLFEFTGMGNNVILVTAG